LVKLWSCKTLSNLGNEGVRPVLDIPSPRMGRGGYDSEDFKDDPQGGTSCTSLFGEQHTSESSDQGREPGTPLFPRQGKGSPCSVSSRGFDDHCNNPLRSVAKRFTRLETRAAALDASLPWSFWRVRKELDNLWREVELIKLGIPLLGQQDPASTPPLFQGCAYPAVAGGVPTLTPSAFEALMRQVINELRSLGFVTQDNLKARASRGSNPNILD
jgi:hypothetical protein